MNAVRFWDTSALLQTADRRAKDHRRALKLLRGPDARKRIQATSMLVSVEALYRVRRRMPQAASELVRTLEDLDRMELGREVEEVAWELTARADGVSGADVVIVASAVLAKRRSGVPVEFVTADKDQALVAAREGLEILLLEGSDPL